MTDHLVGVNGVVQIDPNEVLGIVRDEGVVTGASVLLWPGRWRIALRAGSGGSGGGGPVTWADITGRPSAYPPDVEATQDIIGSMVAAAGGSYDDAAGTITLPAGESGGDIASVTIGSMEASTGTPPTTPPNDGKVHLWFNLGAE